MKGKIIQPKFDDYIDLIRNRVHYYSAKWGVPYDELESQGFLIYVEALSRWRPETASFSTFLWWRLNTLKDYCKTYRRQTQSGELSEEMESLMPARQSFLGIEGILKAAAESISFDAQQLLGWILKRRWEKPYVYYPTLPAAKRVFSYECGWNKERVEIAWNVVESFWLEYAGEI
jgi:hypothetical protein